MKRVTNMWNESAAKVPTSVGFSEQILEIPSLKEIGIHPSFSGLGFVTLKSLGVLGIAGSLIRQVAITK